MSKGHLEIYNSSLIVAGPKLYCFGCSSVEAYGVVNAQRKTENFPCVRCYKTYSDRQHHLIRLLLGKIQQHPSPDFPHSEGSLLKLYDPH